VKVVEIGGSGGRGGVGCPYRDPPRLGRVAPSLGVRLRRLSEPLAAFSVLPLLYLPVALCRRLRHTPPENIQIEDS